MWENGGIATTILNLGTRRVCVSGQLHDPAPLRQVRVNMLLVEWEAGRVSEPVSPLAPIGNRTNTPRSPIIWPSH